MFAARLVLNVVSSWENLSDFLFSVFWENFTSLGATQPFSQAGRLESAPIWLVLLFEVHPPDSRYFIMSVPCCMPLSFLWLVLAYFFCSFIGGFLGCCLLQSVLLNGALGLLSWLRHLYAEWRSPLRMLFCTWASCDDQCSW